jgi:hypothetical protein
MVAVRAQKAQDIEEEYNSTLRSQSKEMEALLEIQEIIISPVLHNMMVHDPSSTASPTKISCLRLDKCPGRNCSAAASPSLRPSPSLPPLHRCVPSRWPLLRHRASPVATTLLHGTGTSPAPTSQQQWPLWPCTAVGVQSLIELRGSFAPAC